MELGDRLFRNLQELLREQDAIVGLVCAQDEPLPGRLPLEIGLMLVQSGDTILSKQSQACEQGLLQGGLDQKLVRVTCLKLDRRACGVQAFRKGKPGNLVQVGVIEFGPQLGEELTTGRLPSVLCRTAA